MRRYNPKEIEPKWQKIWAESGIYTASEDKSRPKRYVLEYFPYPSGSAMHVGHVRNYTIGDTMSRFMRMQGNNVLHPMGWDAFGLPAENYAIKTGISPQEAVAKNVEHFKQQLMQMGFSYDWSREINSTDPNYYKWTQWLFLLLFEKGLAYQKESLQWWCPHDKTVLANEQVENGRCWRCGHEVEKKSLKQWFFKITDYADRLDKDLDKLDWSDSIKAMQHNWIGKSQGAEIDFKIDKDTSAKSYSYVMGVDKIDKELEAVVTIEDKTDNGSYKVSFDKNKSDDFEKLITAKLKPGFWNEYISDQVVFIFKDKRGGVRRIVWDETNEEELLDLCSQYAKTEFIGIREMLEGNDWYAGKVPTSIKVFTTRADTIFGATFLVLAPEHEILNKLSISAEAKKYIQDAERKTEIDRMETDREKTGVFTGFYAINPATKQKIPIWVADYVLPGYGTGAIMAVPAHDERDGEFATKFELAVQEVIENPRDSKELYTGEGRLVNSGDYDGLDSAEAREKITAEFGKSQVNYKLRDWLISRQRYWGAPIPIIHCPKCGPVAVPEKDLPVVLPDVASYEPSGDGRSPLANVPEFVNVECPKCGSKAERETDTMDGFACSSWYFLRFADPHNDKVAFAKDKADFWLPVDDYIGGAEHAVMHLLYARFWTKVMFDEGLIKFDEPFSSLRNHGMILAPDGTKMSKSKNNTIEPDELLQQGYGADSIRLMELFIGPWNQAVNWSVEGIGGTYRFLQRYWTLVGEFLEALPAPNDKDLEITARTHKTIKKVSQDLSRMEFNTAIAAMMELVNTLYKIKTEEPMTQSDGWRLALETLTQLLAPFAPHISEEVWSDLGHKQSVHVSSWPQWDEKLVTEEVMTIAVQVNGKVRAEILVTADITEAEAIEAAKSDERVAAHIKDRPVKKAIYVPGRLVSLAV